MLVLFLMIIVFLFFSNVWVVLIDVVNILDLYLNEGFKSIVGNLFLIELIEVNFEIISVVDIFYMNGVFGYVVIGLISDLIGFEKVVNMIKLYFLN